MQYASQEIEFYMFLAHFWIFKVLGHFLRALKTLFWWSFIEGA